MEFGNLELKAKEDAKKRVQQLLQRVDQLEKVDQYKRRIERKKASVESMLKTAMQSQLDGVRVGLNQLQASLKDVQEIKQNLAWLEDSFGNVPDLSTKLQDVRDENMRHSQYVTAMENLKHIFTVPESVERTKQWITENKLLHAHQSLTDLENSRDDLLFELHKLPNQAPADTIMLKEYFEDVNELSKFMGKQIKLGLERTLNTVRKEPTLIVTILRIIEREEKTDAEADERFQRSGFMPPGRPKHWKQMAMDVLARKAAERIMGTQALDRSDNKMWLVQHLELTRMLIAEDLQVVKDLCVPCFPPHYDVMNVFVMMYHNSLSEHLMELIDSGLVGNEYVTLLSWIKNTYNGPDMMMNPELYINTSSIGPLLESDVVASLEGQYLKNIEENYKEWMYKTLETEKQDWQKGTGPEADDQDYYHTVAPVIIFQMIEQNLQVASTIGQELTFKALLLSIDQVVQYGRLYREAIFRFKNDHFKDRSVNQHFTDYMVTIVNNCLQFEDLANQTKLHYWKPGIHDIMAGQKFETLRSTFQSLRVEAARYLLEEAFLDLESHFQDIVTVNWMLGSLAVDTICITLDDYYNDYRHLRPDNFELVVNEGMNTVAKKYITAMLQKKMTFKNSEDRKSGAIKIRNEGNKLKSFFERIASDVASINFSLDAICSLAEVLKNDDTDMLSLDIAALVKDYPDVSQEHLIQLLGLRGDVSKSDSREIAADALKNTKNAKTIFSMVTGITVGFF